MVPSSVVGPNAGNGYASSVLNEMYGGKLPAAAARLLRDHSQARSASAPPRRTQQAFTTSMAERRPRKCIDLKVPRVGQKGQGHAISLPPKIPHRKQLSQILVETSNYERYDEPTAPGRSREKAKADLQHMFQFGTLAPCPSQEAASSRTRRVGFRSLPPNRDGSRPQGDSGFTKEQEDMAAEIVSGVRARQRELQAVEASLEELTTRAEQAGEGVALRRLVRRDMTDASKQRLELQSAIKRDLQDLEKLMDCAPEE
mmetsp:Transcript_42663/g.117700  ORF Transcript_42663/g.117700 Transcript_42663/m.117700 type:complete len:257 (+) Transcript_42663:65-835(+)